MHFGGHFQNDPKIEYVNGGYSIMKDMPTNEVLKISTIRRIHEQLVKLTVTLMHAISAIQIDRGKVDSYIDAFFKKDMFLLTYSFMIHPVPSMLFFEKSGMPEIIPPLLRKQPGRPKKLRRKDPEELRQNQQSTRKNLTVTCGLCKKLGHNSRTCRRRKSVRDAGGSDSQQQPLRDFGSTSSANPVRDAGGSDSQQQPLRDFGSTSNATTTRSKQSGKQPTQVTPTRTNVEEVTQKSQHAFPPRRSPRLQKLTVISKAKSKKLEDSTMIAQANFPPRGSPRGSIAVSAGQVPLKPHKSHKPGVAMNLAQKFGKTQSK